MEPVTWDRFTWVTGGLVSLTLAVGGVAIAALRGKAGLASVSRLWESHNADKDNLAAYKTQVAETYPTKQNLSEMKGDLLTHMDGKFADLKEEIRSLKKGA